MRLRWKIARSARSIRRMPRNGIKRPWIRATRMPPSILGSSIRTARAWRRTWTAPAGFTKARRRRAMAGRRTTLA
ncbi:hypothetical protein AL037_15850 [Salipiger aestuarii]|nr:hypothetical protein AL037_15850 [Salipiger aestuarii]